MMNMMFMSGCNSTVCFRLNRRLKVDTRCNPPRVDWDPPGGLGSGLVLVLLLGLGLVLLLGFGRPS